MQKTNNTNKRIREYWDERAKTAQQNINATTDDVFLRELEIKTLTENIKKIKRKKLFVLDLGCGDGFTTIGIAKNLGHIKIDGIDYSKNMIDNALTRLKKERNQALKERINFRTGDATQIGLQVKSKTYDVVISSRCLINLASTQQQYNAIKQISKVLKKNGVYISIENFEDGNKNLNELRLQMGLPQIQVRWHNLFFSPKEYLNKTLKHFNNVEIINFSSSYYYATRVIYSKYCQMKNIQPDYLHEIHKLAVALPSEGNHSPIKLVIHKK